VYHEPTSSPPVIFWLLYQTYLIILPKFPQHIQSLSTLYKCWCTFVHLVLRFHECYLPCFYMNRFTCKFCTDSHALIGHNRLLKVLFSTRTRIFVTFSALSFCTDSYALIGHNRLLKILFSTRTKIFVTFSALPTP